MELHQIRYFLAVERLRNFSRAAEACNITQPALTRAIQKLEIEVGGKLFLRRPGNIELTALGRAVLPRLQHAFQEIVETRADAIDLSRHRGARLRLGVMCTIGPGALAGVIARLKAAEPALDLTLTETKGTSIVAALLNDEVDIALVGLPRYPDTLDATPLFDESYVVAIPPGHRFESSNAVALADLDGENYIERINCEFDDHFEFTHGEWPIELNVRYRSEREDWVQAMVLAGVGIAILPQSLPLMRGVSSARLIAPEVSRTISLASAHGRPLPHAASKLRDIVSGMSWA